MKRVMVIGCSGSGKSTFSRKLAEATGLELINLDQYYWKSGWEETDKDEWAATVEKLSDRPTWIIDGTYGGTLHIRLEKADTIIFLDRPTLTCLWRITKRILKYRGQSRPEMPEGCPERFNLDFYHYVATFNLVRRKRLLEKLNGLSEEKKVLVFRSDEETQDFLKNHNWEFANEYN